MSRSRRLYHAALGGCVAAFFLAATPILGQEAVEAKNGPAENQEAPKAGNDERTGDSAVEAQDAPALVTPDDEGGADAAGDQQAEESQQPPPPAFKWDGLVKTNDTLAQWVMAFFAFAATVISGVAVELLRRTLRYTRNAADYTRVAAEAAQLAAREAEETTYIGHETLEQSRSSTERQLRAYVHIVSVERTPFAAERPLHQSDIITVNTRNYGQTPAYDFTIKVALIWGESEDAVAFDLSKARTAAQSTLGPSADHFTTRKVSRHSAKYEGFRKGKTAIFIYGQIKYRDAFGKDRTTNFRLRNTDYRVASFANCEEGNSAD